MNGIIVQGYSDNLYKGVDGSGFSEGSARNWFLNDEDDLADSFEAYYKEHIDIGWTYDIPDHYWVGACNDMDHIYKYVKEAEKRKAEKAKEQEKKKAERERKKLLEKIALETGQSVADVILDPVVVEFDE